MFYEITVGFAVNSGKRDFLSRVIGSPHVKVHVESQPLRKAPI